MVRGVSKVPQHPKSGQYSVATKGDAGGMVDDLVSFAEQDGKGVNVSCSDRGINAGTVRTCSVWSHGAANRTRPLGREPFDPSTGLRAGSAQDKLVEARECLLAVIGSEHLVARQEAIGSEDPEREDGSLVSAAAGALRAEIRPANEERIGSQREDVVYPRDGLVDQVEQGPKAAQECLGPLEGRQAGGR
jgi:hypothetical protein